jgi:hypothetical protein
MYIPISIATTLVSALIGSDLVLQLREVDTLLGGIPLTKDTDLPSAFRTVDAVARYKLSSLARVESGACSGSLGRALEHAQVSQVYKRLRMTCIYSWLLQVVSEYFSVSNDGASKMMIGDAFPGQKLEFLKEGISTIRSDIQSALFCEYAQAR